MDIKKTQWNFILKGIHVNVEFLRYGHIKTWFY